MSGKAGAPASFALWTLDQVTASTREEKEIGEMDASMELRTDRQRVLEDRTNVWRKSA